MSECATCGKENNSDVWLPGEVCMFGNLYVCSLICALEWANINNHPISSRDIEIPCEYAEF